MSQKLIDVAIDIETIPNQNLTDLEYEIIYRKVLKDDYEKIKNDTSKYFGGHIESKEIIKYASLNQEFNQIVCICVNINDNIFSFSGKNERNILLDFWETFNEFKSFEIKLITFNGKRFDIPIILFRSLKNLIQPSIKFSYKRYDTVYHIDILEILTNFYQNQNFLTMKEYAKILNIENTDNDNGCDVFKLFNSNNIKDIVNHCISDIDTTKKLYEKIKPIYFL